jgi:hypothetical protein
MAHLRMVHLGMVHLRMIDRLCGLVLRLGRGHLHSRLMLVLIRLNLRHVHFRSVLMLRERSARQRCERERARRYEEFHSHNVSPKSGDGAVPRRLPLNGSTAQWPPCSR